MARAIAITWQNDRGVRVPGLFAPIKPKKQANKQNPGPALNSSVYLRLRHFVLYSLSPQGNAAVISCSSEPTAAPQGAPSLAGSRGLCVRA